MECCTRRVFPSGTWARTKKVQHAYEQVVMPALRQTPATPDPPKIKKLAKFKNLWRIRLSDTYRLIYKVEPVKCNVIMLMLGHRKDIYKRAGINEDGEPGTRIVGKASELLEEEPSLEEKGRAVMEIAQEGLHTTDSNLDSPLPAPLEEGTLESWGIPQKYWIKLRPVRTEGELMALEPDIPSGALERIFNGLWPKQIEEIIEQPVRAAKNTKDLLDAANGDRSLDSFLLELDETQLSFVSRFETDSPVGPWLLKGGPGSGKSTIALYCIHALLKHFETNPSLQKRDPPRVLFTTYTNALTKSLEHLLNSLARLYREWGVSTTICPQCRALAGVANTLH